ncbi:MAG: hypothetical protein HWQ42_16925 [Nostoc sp. JL23]|uniref:hypothetical protein n=1 Tax=uncultured Nostoc sp. TaxID=340711 RepID=UPI001D25F59F|nr:hypothetical protein [Nostoc sp. JL23]
MTKAMGASKKPFVVIERSLIWGRVAIASITPIVSFFLPVASIAPSSSLLDF